MIPSQYHRLKILAVAALATTTAIAGASAFQIDMEPLFKAQGGPGWDHPIAVELQNDGPEARGVLHVTGVGFSMDYPVDLARGSTKRIIAYTLANYGETRATLETDQGSETKTAQFPFGGSDGNTQILMIGDQIGALSFLRTRTPQPFGAPADVPIQTGAQAITAADSYCIPEDAPPRAVGYSAIQAVVLGPGSERLTDAAVAALKTWALEGGTLVFIGKEASPVLSDARWQPLLPSTDFKAITFKTSDALASIGQRELTEPVTLLEPQGAQGVAVRTDGKTTISTESGFGAGRVVFLAFDPFDPSLKDWAGLAPATTEILRVGLLGQQQQLASRWSFDTAAYGGPGTRNFASTSPDGSYVAYSGQNTGVMPYTGPGAADDPFSAKLPPSGQVFEFLAVYFLAVIPLNFLILRKLKRAELAWFTAPVLSLAFASVLFRSAGHLYTEKLSTATQGVVMVHPDAPSAVFIGNTTMFIPNGGRYDLAMKGVDSIGNIDQPYSDPFFRNNSKEVDLNPVDNGQVTVPNMLASNLAFREISYRQQVPLAGLYSVSMHRVGADAVCEIRNGGKTDLTNAYVWVGKHVVSANTIAAGETKTVRIDLTKSNQPNGMDGQVNTVESSLSYFGGAALQARLNDFRPGPQIGEQVAARSDVTLLVFSKDALGGIR